MLARGWLDLTNAAGELTVGGRRIVFAGVDDSHLKRDRTTWWPGPADRSADVRIGLAHSPEPRVLDRFAADGYDLLLCGHTHGGQLRIPFYGALVTNCGIDRDRVRWLHRWAEPTPERPAGTWLHVSAGLGTSPYAPVAVRLPARGHAAHPHRPRRLSPPPEPAAEPGARLLQDLGVWRSLVARVVRDDEAAGSNPVTPTTSQGPPMAAPESFPGAGPLSGRRSTPGRMTGRVPSPVPPPRLSPEVTARWQARFRAPRVSLPGWAEDAPHRCLYSSDVSGVVEQYAWDRQTGEHRQVTDRPNGTLIATLSPDGETIWWFADTDGDEFGVWRTQPFAGGPDAVAVAEVGPAYPAGLEVGRTLVAIGRSTDDGSELWLAPSGGARPGDLPAPRPGVASTRSPATTSCWSSRTPSTATRATRRCACSAPPTPPRTRPPSSPRSGTARAAACTRWSSARCPTTGGCWSATSGAAARSC